MSDLLYRVRQWVFTKVKPALSVVFIALVVVSSHAALAAKKAGGDASLYAVDGKFSRDTVSELARKLSKKAYKAPLSVLPESLQDLNYDQYRDIRFNPEGAIWADESLPFQMQLFHRGFYFQDPVEIAIVDEGVAKHLSYSPELFSTGNVMQEPLPKQDIGFAGFRLHYPINRDDYLDELVVFQGASYFRSLGKHQAYGLSARGLAIKTAEPDGEEFPVFRAFWIEKPTPDSQSVVVYALMDSPSVTGAYRFTIRPGRSTAMDVEATLFPRVELKKIGLGAGTSMFMFSSYGRQNVDDFRPRVHDSDGLLMLNGRGERLWRPLSNPQDLRTSAFMDNGPLGFGLMQRNRDFKNYQDLEARYEKRPSLWVEPVGNWGKGSVVLVEIPSESEIHDNIVAYWSPKESIPAGTEFSFAYRLLWGNGPQAQSDEAIVLATRSGRADISGPSPERLFVIDYGFPASSVGSDVLPTADVKHSAGSVSHVVVAYNPETKGYRVSFELDPEDERLIELRLNLLFDDGRKAESWMYQWTR